MRQHLRVILLALVGILLAIPSLALASEHTAMDQANLLVLYLGGMAHAMTAGNGAGFVAEASGALQMLWRLAFEHHGATLGLLCALCVCLWRARHRFAPATRTALTTS